ncbi:hypothetical protein CJ030_MR5G022427 [Morella rubra]|uniref:Uncharacterized protein n=1 Tax=Morella rubra TaxID=262757 RepID=A0A6A1VN83_9ROSI|nr:hypothetical protein CJ030_MR5G022427 [Morella rubra]
MFVMYCLITRTCMNLGHLMLNQMKVTTKKKKQGLHFAMLFTHLFFAYDVEVTGEVRGKPKESKEYNKKTLRLMGFVETDNGECVRKVVVTPKKVDSKAEEEDKEGDDGAGDIEGTPIADRSHMSDRTPILRPHELLIATSSRTWASSAHEPRLGHPKASIVDLKIEQQKLSKSVEDIATSLKIGFVDMEKILTDYTKRFETVDRDVKSLQNHVSNSITGAVDVIQGTTDEFKATSVELQTFVKKSQEDITQVTEVCMNTDRLLRPHVMKWTYWFTTIWMQFLKKFEMEFKPPPPPKKKI